MKKTGSLPDLQHAEEAQSKAQAGKAGQATSPPGRQSQEAVPGPSVLKRESAGPQSLPQRTSWQQPMQPVSQILPMLPQRGLAGCFGTRDVARKISGGRFADAEGQAMPCVLFWTVPARNIPALEEEDFALG